MRCWKFNLILLLGITCGLITFKVNADTTTTLTEDAIIKALGWVPTSENRCGGYYLEEPIIYPENFLNTDKLLITSKEGLFAFHGTSVSQGKVTITRAGQQITANKAYLYRDVTTGKLSSVDMIGDVRLREPNQLVVAKSAHYDLKSSEKSLHDILYRTTVSGNLTSTPTVSYVEQQQEHKVTQLSAWGQANHFSQNQPKIYDFSNASYSTCPPTNPAWQVKAEKIELNKNTGRGYATNARLYVKKVPVFYTPYFNFPIDARRQSGFLFPKFGSSGRFGPYLMAPYYWNMAPNYDNTITPAILTKRGIQLSDLHRYLTPIHSGQINLAVLPNDKQFKIFQQQSIQQFQNSTNPTTQANLRILQNTSTTRDSFSWQDTAHYTEKWSSNVNFNYVSDPYYIRDLNTHVQTVTDNQLLQAADLDYNGPHWDFITRLQAYQTLNPIDAPTPVATQYSRLPEIILNGNYPDNNLFGLDYFINNDLTRFDIHNAPGDSSKLPMGNRINIQPGISKPIDLPYLEFTPRIQFAMTQYDIGRVQNNSPMNLSRALPIIDVDSEFYLDRETTWFNQPYKQTLEPRIYYAYVPYRNQNSLPIFDTTLNTFTYDQLFTYNRFSSIDRIGDTNQISLGLATRFIDESSGYEKIYAGVGEVVYLEKRRVILCTNSDDDCSDFENNVFNNNTLSPLSGIIKYNVNPSWNLTSNTIWNPQPNKINNQSLILQYNPDSRRIINLGYNFARTGDPSLPWEPPGSIATNLSQTDLSGTWPIARDWEFLGRWTENWNQRRLQNLLSGLQYDSCCWAIRFVAGRTYISTNPNNTLKYNNQFYVEFSLKGLGNLSPGGDVSSLLSSSISGYHSNFGRDY